MAFDFSSITTTKFGFKKRQIYLVLLLILIISAILFLFWNYFFIKPAPPVVQPLPPPEIKINFEILKSPLLEELELIYQQIPPITVELGRENPFIPY
jgi:hypothetical protein